MEKVKHKNKKCRAHNYYAYNKKKKPNVLESLRIFFAQDEK